MAGVTALVLAAGASERMGQPKLLLPFGDTTILRATIGAVASSAVDDIGVVTGADAEAVEASIADLRVRVARNPDFRRGNMSSLLAGVAASPHVDAFVQVPGDVPLLSPATIDAMVQRWNDDQSWAAVTEYRDRIGHPFLLSRAAVDETSSIEGSKVLWRALVASRDPRVEHVPYDGSAPLDVNTPRDYDALLAERGSATTPDDPAS